MSKLLTVPEVMAHLQRSRAKVYELINSGELESIKLGRSRRVPADALELFIARLRSEARGGVSRRVIPARKS